MHTARTSDCWWATTFGVDDGVAVGLGVGVAPPEPVTETSSTY